MGHQRDPYRTASEVDVETLLSAHQARKLLSEKEEEKEKLEELLKREAQREAPHLWEEYIQPEIINKIRQLKNSIELLDSNIMKLTYYQLKALESLGTRLGYKTQISYSKNLGNKAYLILSWEEEK